MKASVEAKREEIKAGLNKRHVRKAVENLYLACDGNVGWMAELLEMDVTSTLRLLQYYGIRRY